LFQQVTFSFNVVFEIIRRDILINCAIEVESKVVPSSQYLPYLFYPFGAEDIVQRATHHEEIGGVNSQLFLQRRHPDSSLQVHIDVMP